MVREKYVHRDLNYMWQQLEHYSVMLSALLDIAKQTPLHQMEFNRIIAKARERRQTEAKHKIRYAAVNNHFSERR